MGSVIESRDNFPRFKMMVQPVLAPANAYAIKITFFVKSFEIGGFNKKDAKQSVNFTFVLVETATETKLFRANAGPLTVDSDGSGPAYNDCCHQNEVATGLDINADKVPYTVTASPLLKEGGSEKGSRVFVVGKERDSGKEKAVTATIQDNGVEHGFNEGSINLAREFHMAGWPGKVDVNDGTNRDQHVFEFWEELGSAPKKMSESPNLTKGADAEKSRSLMMRAREAIKNHSSGRSTQGTTVTKKTFDFKEIIKKKKAAPAKAAAPRA